MRFLILFTSKNRFMKIKEFEFDVDKSIKQIEKLEE
jgi:hypothetical protein